MRALEFLIERTVLNVADVDAHINTLCQRAEDERIQQWLKRNYRNWLMKDSQGVLRVRGRDGVFQYETGVDYPTDKLPAWIDKAVANNEEMVHISNLRKLEDEFGEVIDYLNHLLQGRRADLSRLSVPQAVQQSEEWHERLAHGDPDAAGQDDTSGVKTVLPAGNGWRWVQIIETDALDREGSLMQHCVGGGSYDAGMKNGTIQIYSLRDPKNEPHITVEVRKGIIYQFKGKQNRPPTEKYRQASVIFLNHLGLPDRDSLYSDLKDMALTSREDNGRWRYGLMEEVADHLQDFGRLKAYKVPRGDKQEFYLIDSGRLILKAVQTGDRLALSPKSEEIKTTYFNDVAEFLNHMALPIDGAYFEEFNLAGRYDDRWTYGSVKEVAHHERELAPGIDLYTCRMPGGTQHLYIMAGDRRLAFLTAGKGSVGSMANRSQRVISRFRDETRNEDEQRVIIDLLNELGLTMGETVARKMPYRAVASQDGKAVRWGMIREVGTPVVGMPEGTEAFMIEDPRRQGDFNHRSQAEYCVFLDGKMVATVDGDYSKIYDIIMSRGSSSAPTPEEMTAVAGLLNTLRKPISSNDTANWLKAHGIYWVPYTGREEHVKQNSFGTIDQVGRLVKDFGDGKRAYILPGRKRGLLLLMDGNREIKEIIGGRQMERAEYGLDDESLPYVVQLIREGLCRVDTFGNRENDPDTMAGALKQAGYHIGAAWQWQYDEEKDNIDNPTHFDVLYHDDDLALPVKLTIRNAKLRKNLSVEKMTLGEVFDEIIGKPIRLPDDSGITEETFNHWDMGGIAANVFSQGACIYDLPSDVGRIRFKIERLDGKTSGYFADA